MSTDKRCRTRSVAAAGRGRRGRLGPTLALLFTSALLADAAPARAGRHDLRLLNLCPPNLSGGIEDCRWVSRAPDGRITGVTIDAGAAERFRSLMSQLGTVLAPAVASPATSLGYAGFQVSADVATTTIDSDADYWDGTGAVNPANRTAARPAGSLTTIGASVRKGIWLPIPSMEVGAGFVHLLESQIIAYNGYAKLAIHEGFNDWPLPAVAGRVALSHMTGSAEARLDVLSFDLVGSKPFGIMGTLSAEPYAGWSHLRMKARSGRFDLTPGCDGYAAATGGGNPGPQCQPGQIGGTDDLELGYAQFPNQDVIVRNGFFAGVKLHLWVFHLTAQYTRVLSGSSRDQGGSTQGTAGAKDNASAQNSLLVSAGFDY